MIKIKKFNNVTDDLGQVLNDKLQSFAQETGQISYTDIINYGKNHANSAKNKKLNYMLDKWNQYIEAGMDDKALKKSSDIVQVISGKLDPCKEFCDKLSRFSNTTKTYQIQGFNNDRNDWDQLATVDAPSKTDALKYYKEDSDKSEYDGLRLRAIEVNESLKKFGEGQYMVEWKHLGGSHNGKWDRDSAVFNSKEDARKYIREQRAKYDLDAEDHKARVVNVNKIEYSDGREKVSAADLEKAKTEGVVQKKPNGSWGIISIDAKEWWDANYDSKEDAESALAAYHANKEFSSATDNIILDNYNGTEEERKGQAEEVLDETAQEDIPEESEELEGELYL